VAGFAVTTTSAIAQHDTASEAARSVIDGIILGGKVGPDFYGFVPANIESRVAASGFAPTRSVAEQLSSPPRGPKKAGTFPAIDPPCGASASSGEEWLSDQAVAAMLA
jgi:hypothetical protein